MNKSLCLRKQAAQSERRLLRRKARQGREEREDDDHRSAERSQQPVRTCIPMGLRREDVQVVAVTDLTGSVQFCMLGYPYLSLIVLHFVWKVSTQQMSQLGAAGCIRLKFFGGRGEREVRWICFHVRVEHLERLLCRLYS